MWSTQHFGPGSAGEPSPAEIEAWRGRVEVPNNELGCALPVAVVLGRTADAAIAVTSVTAFTTGVSFNLAVRLRVLPDSIRAHGLFGLVGGHHMPGIDMDPDRQLLLGVEYADGRTATNAGRPVWPLGTEDEAEPILVPHGGGGGDLAVDQTYWLSPVPPDGPFTFVCSWQAFGIPETRHVVEHADLSQASSQAVVLWPRQPVNHGLGPPPEPKLPSSGWFGWATRRQRDPGPR